MASWQAAWFALWQSSGSRSSPAPAGGGPRWRCKACRTDFSLTSGTLFAFHKLKLQVYLAAVVISVNEVKGKSALALSRDLRVQYNTAFVLAHKIREAMGADIKGVVLGGEGRTAEVDGCYIGRHVRPENRKEDREDRRLSANQNGKGRVVLAICERHGRTVTQVFESEAAAAGFLKARVDRGTVLHANESAAWNPLHASFETKRISQQDAYSLDGACPTRRKASSPACAGPRSGLTTTSRVPTSSATRGRPPSRRTGAGRATASSSAAW